MKRRYFLEAFKLSKRYGDLLEASELIVEDPGILRGTPIFRGTRIPICEVAASLELGASANRLVAAYPALTERMIYVAKLYAKAKPVRRERSLGATAGKRPKKSASRVKSEEEMKAERSKRKRARAMGNSSSRSKI